MKKVLCIAALLIVASINIVGQVTITMERHGNVFYVPGKVNGLPLKFIFDTGASDVYLSLTEALFMLKNGYLSDTDFGGTSYSQIANGAIVENTEVILKEVKIGSIKICNVKAQVTKTLEAPLLFGQSAIQKLGPIQLDGNKLIISNVKDFVTDNQPGQLYKQTYQAEEPGTNVGLTLSQLQRNFPSLRYVKTDNQGVHYHDGEDPSEGVNSFFVVKDNIVMEECLMVQDTNSFPLLWWRKMCDKFYNDRAYWDVIHKPSHYQFFYSTFKINLIYMEENGVNTCMIVYSKL